MDRARPLTKPRPRRDGWTPARRRQFLGLLAAGTDVRRACARVGLSRQATYALRRRDAVFARAWDDALRAARQAAEEAWLAMLPERLRRAMEAPCEEALGDDGVLPLDPVNVANGV